MNNKPLLVILSVLVVSNACAERIKIKFEDRTITKTTVFGNVIPRGADTIWFHAHDDNEALFMLSYEDTEHNNFAESMLNTNSKSTIYKVSSFTLPLNILESSSATDMYKPLLEPLFYPSYFN